MTASDCNKNVQSYKIYQAMFRVIKESENVDERQHCFLVQTAGQESRYFSMETRQDLLKVESAWHRSVCQTVSQMGVSDQFCWFSFHQTELNFMDANNNFIHFSISEYNLSCGIQ